MKNNIGTKIAFVSLGCDKNLVDSEIMLGIIDEEGYTITPDEENADVVIINTCGFKLDATEEGIENILKIAQYKTDFNCKGIIVTGCMAQRYREEIFESIPEVDAVVGTSDFEEIGRVIKEVMDGQKVQLITDNNKKLSDTLGHKRILTTPGHYAYLKISEGCNSHCTYCTIPSIRGKHRSRDFDSLIEEARILSEKGVKELILVAQDLALYGIDLYGEFRLHELVRELSKIESIEWIRLLYLYPEKITDELIEEMATNDKVCKYIDMPIQHSDDTILKLMARSSSTEKLHTIINKLRNKMPDIVLRTTLIVGFPTENEEQFKNLCDFVEEVKFDRLGVFEYSQEEGTKAGEMDGQIDEETKVKRKEYILSLQKEISAQKTNDMVGQTLKVIVDGKLEEENVYCGRSSRDCVEIDGLIFFNCDYELLAGDFVNVKITEGLDYDLIGEIVE